MIITVVITHNFNVLNSLHLWISWAVFNHQLSHFISFLISISLSPCLDHHEKLFTGQEKVNDDTSTSINTVTGIYVTCVSDVSVVVFPHF